MMKYLRGIKPAQIANELQLAKRTVYNTVDRFKARSKEGLSLPVDSATMMKRSTRKNKRDNEVIIECVKAAIELIGLYSVTVGSIYSHLQRTMPPGVAPPGHTTISRILHRHFHMRYRNVDPASAKFFDPSSMRRDCGRPGCSPSSSWKAPCSSL